MRFLPRVALWLLASVLLPLGGCKPPPESVRVKEPVSGPPDLVKDATASGANRAYQLRAFHLNHIWANGGQKGPDGDFRAKVTVWDYADDESVVAELYFDDAGHESAATNPDPTKTQRPYRIHFPMSAFGPILGTLRNTNEPIFLYYYDGGWAVGTYSAEPIGID